MSTCDSCGRPAQVTTPAPEPVDFIETYDEISTLFLLCLGCVPVEQRATVTALPGHEAAVDLDLGLLELHHMPAPTAPALAGAAR